jgi:hypothetical protein
MSEWQCGREADFLYSFQMTNVRQKEMREVIM